jgi:hypothetical protein
LKVFLFSKEIHPLGRVIELSTLLPRFSRYHCLSKRHNLKFRFISDFRG